MMDWIVMVGFQLLMLVIAAVLLQGKGGWLIAGFNMLSKEQKALVDWKGLCRFMGKIMLGVWCAYALYLGYLYTQEVLLGIMAAALLIGSTLLALFWTHAHYRPFNR